MSSQHLVRVEVAGEAVAELLGQVERQRFRVVLGLMPENLTDRGTPTETSIELIPFCNECVVSENIQVIQSNKLNEPLTTNRHHQQPLPAEIRMVQEHWFLPWAGDGPEFDVFNQD